MLRKFFLSCAIVIVVVFACFFSTNASSWPSRNLNQTLNRHVIDPGVLNSVVNPFSIDVATNTLEMIAGDGYLFYSDAAAQSTVYAVNIKDRSSVWNKKLAMQVTTMVYEDGRIYFGADKFYCLNAVDGEEIWATSPGSSGSTAYRAKVMQYDEQNIYGFRFINSVYRLAVLRKSDGSVVKFLENTFSSNVNDFAVFDGNLYFTTTSGGSNNSTKLHKVSLATFSLTTSAQSCLSSSTKMVLDPERSQAILSASDAEICLYDLDSLAQTAYSSYPNANRFIKYNDKYYSTWGDNFLVMSSLGQEINVSKEKINDGTSFQSDPLIVNEYFFSGVWNGAIWSKNLETGETKRANVSTEGGFRQILYDSGYLVSLINYGTSGNYKTKIVFSDINDLSASPTYSVSISSPYKTQGMNQYLGQLHCHYVPDIPAWNKVFNGEPNPAFTVDKYNQAGYDFVALTEHNQVVPMPVLDESNILQIQDAMESTQGYGHHHILAIGVNENIDNGADDQNRIDEINSQGAISIFAHPDSWFYGASTKLINTISNLTYLEAYNTAVEKYSIAGEGQAFDDFDKLQVLRNYKIITAGDDYTPGNGFFDGAAVVVYAASNSQSDIMNSLKLGNFYALQGSEAPRINVNVEGKVFSVEANQLSNISFIGKGGRKLATYKSASNANYSIQGDETYVRAEVESVGTGKKSWTQAVNVEQIYDVETLLGGSHSIYLGQAYLYSNTSESIKTKILQPDEYPGVVPPTGYLSPIYQFSTSGSVLADNSLAVSYADIELPVRANNLSIYSYDETLKAWSKLESNVDGVNKLVTTSLPHYSLYTLSAEVPEDDQPPNIVLAAPAELGNISGEVMLEADASDDQVVTTVRFILNDKDIGSDILAEDGWGIQFDFSKLPSGRYELVIEAEDFSGNIGSATYTLGIQSGVAQPIISIIAPLENDFLKDISKIAGSFSSDLEVEEINIFLDDIYIDKAEIAGSQFSKDVDWSQFVEGEHIVKVELVDKSGNIAVDEAGVNVGENITATIISPKDQNYLRSSQILLQLDVVPEVSVETYIDGNLVENYSTLDLLNYALGDHSVEVKYFGETIASTTFVITTNYQDTINIVRRLEKDECFKNHGIPTAIIARLRAAELAHLLRAYRAETTILNNLEQYIEQQSEGRKPKMNEKAKNILFENVQHLIANI